MMGNKSITSVAKSKSLFGKLIAIGGILGASYLLIPKQANAVSFDSFVRRQDALNSTLWLKNPAGTDSVSNPINLWIPKMQGYYAAIDAPGSWELELGDTCEIYVKSQDGQKKHTTQKEVTYMAGNLFMPLFLDDSLNYTIAVGTCNSTPDTLVEGRCKVKHNGNFSEELIDTFNISTSYHDLYFNLAKSDSVWNWTNGGNWDDLLGDSVFVSANAINVPGSGSTSGVIQREYIDGDILDDIVLIGVDEENKIKPKNLEGKVWPTVTKNKVNVSGWNNVDVYDVTGRKVGSYGYSGTTVYSFGLPESAGVYHIVDKESGKSKKIVKTE